MRYYLFLAAIALAMWQGGVADAALIIYNSRAAFNAAAPGLPLETFESSTLTSGNAVSFAGPLSSLTNNSTFSAGSLLNGFSLSTTSDNVYTGRDFGGSPGANVSSVLFAANMNLDFTPGVTAIGLDLQGWNSTNGPWTVDVIGPGGSLGVYNLPTGQFFGVISTSGPISRLFLDKPNTGGTIDNLAFGLAPAAEVPEPASLALWSLMSVAGLAAWRRRRKATTA